MQPGCWWTPVLRLRQSRPSQRWRGLGGRCCARPGERLHGVASRHSSRLTRRLAGCTGRNVESYREACDVAQHLPDREREVVVACAERQSERLRRRTGAPHGARRILRRILLRAEILMIHRRDDEARQLLHSCSAASEDDRVRTGYELGLIRSRRFHFLAIIKDRRHCARLLRQRAADVSRKREGDATAALAAVDRSSTGSNAIQRRRCAARSHVMSFSRRELLALKHAAALEGLSVAEETQGDRAAPSNADRRRRARSPGNGRELAPEIVERVAVEAARASLRGARGRRHARRADPGDMHSAATDVCGRHTSAAPVVEVDVAEQEVADVRQLQTCALRARSSAC